MWVVHSDHLQYKLSLQLSSSLCTPQAFPELLLLALQKLTQRQSKSKYIKTDLQGKVLNGEKLLDQQNFPHKT